MPFDCATVIGKMTRSLSSSSGRKTSSTSSPFVPGVRLRTFGTDARRAVGSTDTLPSAAMVPERNVSEDTCPSPTARRLKMNRQPFSGAPVENLEQVPVPALEVLEHFAQLLGGCFGIKPKHPLDNMIGANLVGRVEVSGLSRRLEGPYDDPRRVRAEIEALAIHEFGGGQRCSLVAIGLILRRRRWRIIFSTQVSGGFPLSRPQP